MSSPGRSNGGEARPGNWPHAIEHLALYKRRRISSQLDQVIEGLDGTVRIALPDTVGGCDRRCRAADSRTLAYWADELGSCPCPAARQAVIR